jgi:LAS superfamily LD-carboxypeptidase LdcB
LSIQFKIAFFLLLGIGAVLLIPQLKDGSTPHTPEAEARQRRVYLFAPTQLHNAAGERMAPANITVQMGLLTVLENPIESGDFTWLRIRDERTGNEGWIHEHLTSNESIAMDSNNALPIGHERVDRFFALPHNYRPDDLVPLNMRYCRIRQIELRREAAEAFIAMHYAAASEGIYLYGFSGYRSYDTQRELYLNRIQRGERHRQRYVARPGHTEHQLGTTLDVVGNDTSIAAQHAFDATREAAWLRTECYKYGFVLSYGRDNIVPTGYGFESWHIRYVGKENAIKWIRDHLSPENPIYKKYITGK